MPFAKVEVAEEETMLSTSACTPFPKVEVAVPPTFRSPEMVVEPVLEMVKRVEVAKAAVEEPMAKRVVALPLVVVVEVKIETSAKGDVVPMPILLVGVMSKDVFVEEPTTN